MILATGEASAASGAAHGGVAAAHGGGRAAFARSIAHHRRGRSAAVFWPDTGYWDYGPTSGEPAPEVAPPASGDVHYTYTYDAPWDAVHRLPPNVLPSTRPYVSDCTTQTVTVPRHRDPQQTANINITRCY
ncbi:MAG TPA: hypothetical protein VGM09_04415 [Bradyrhizobium sp.]